MGQNTHHQKFYKQLMLERVWREGNLPTQLVGIHVGITVMENSMQIPQKLNIELPQDPEMPLLGINLEKTIIQKDRCTPMFTAALFVHCSTIYNSQIMEATKIYNNKGEDKDDVVCIYIYIYIYLYIYVCLCVCVCMSCVYTQ